MVVHPRFSVVIPVRNRAEVVGRAVSDVLAQTLAAVEVVVVDAASNDDSVEAARSVADRRVRVLTGNAGLAESTDVAEARRVGIEAALGRWVSVLDPDDEVSPGWLARLGRIAEATGAVLVSCGGEQTHVDGSTTRIEHGCYRSGSFVARRALMHSDPARDVLAGGGDLAALGSELEALATADGRVVVATPEPLVRWNEPSGEEPPSGDPLRLRWALQSLDAMARTPIPDAALMVRSATAGAIAAVRLGDHDEARRLFRLARGIAPDEAKLWARWAVSCVPSLASRVWTEPAN